jgi:OmpA-OmpF porin, OOP family
MKLRSILLVCAATAAICGSALASDATGWYVGLGAGLSIPLDQKLVLRGTQTAGYKLQPKDSGLFAGMFGYRFSNRIRIENELSYDYHSVNEKFVRRDESIAIKGHESAFADIVNVFYDQPLSSKWDVFVGAGVGIASFKPKFTDSYYDGEISGGHLALIAQGLVGVSYSVSDDIDIGLDYRYRQVSGYGNLDVNTALENVGYTHARLNTVAEHAVMLTARFYFTPPPPLPLPPPPPPPPQPAPPPVVKPITTYIVFFDFNKSNLTAKAQQVLAEAVQAAQANGLVKIVVTGHTDTVGSDKYNKVLSLARAQAVKDELIRLGLSGNGISVDGKGFHELLVATDPGVREPQNRRAVVELGK